MKTIAVGNFVGFEVSTIQEVVKAQACGLAITDKDANTYDYYFSEENEDGEYIDRDPTDQEVFNKIAEDIKNGNTLLAGFWLDTDKYQIVPTAATTLQSNFHVGQEVYTMRGNKIVKAELTHIWLSLGKQTYMDDTDWIVSKMTREIHNCVTSCSVNDATLDYMRKQINKCKVKDVSMAYLKIDGHYYLVELSEVFATKEELVKHLMEE